VRIGLLHQADRIDGGVYQYSLSVIEALVKNDPENDYTVINSGSDASNLPQGADIVSPPQDGFSFGVLRRLYVKSLRILPIPLPLLIPFSLTGLGRWNKRGNTAESLGWDLLVCTSPTLAGRQMRVPYIVVIHDLMHKYNTAERHRWKEKVFRDFVYKQGAQHSILTVVSSEWSKRDLHRFYGIPLDKIRVVPEFVPPYVREYRGLTAPEIDLILKRFKLPERYVFYPAQFWRHKNHINLVKALYRIKREYRAEVPAVFVGAPKEAFREVMSLIDRLGLTGQITYLGYVSDKEIVALYKRAVALVMPSWFNVSSIPVVEALALGTCCLCADVAPLPEQVGDAGLLFDPYDEKDIAEKVWRIWKDDNLRHDLLAKGTALVEERYRPDVFAQRWREVVREAIEICGSRGRALSESKALAGADR
jgi:glycosyltransferase involved in cell wall biosynthesis